MSSDAMTTQVAKNAGTEKTCPKSAVRKLHFLTGCENSASWDEQRAVQNAQRASGIFSQDAKIVKVAGSKKLRRFPTSV